MTKGLDIPSQGNTLETFKVSELKDKFEIKVTPEELKKYGDTLLNMSEIQKIKEGTSTITQLGLEKLKRSVDNTSNAINQFKEDFKPKEVMERSQNGLNEIDDKLKSAYNNVGGEIKQDIKTGVKKATEVGKKLQKGGYSVQLGEALSDAFSKLKNFDIFGALISLFKGLFGMFVGNEALKKAGDKIKEKLKPEEVSKAKKEVVKILKEKYPGKEEQIKNIINSPSISEEQIGKIYKKIKAGEEITIKDISSILPQLGNIFSEKERKELLLEAQQKAINSIKTSLEKKYPGIEISGDKLKDLEKITIKYFNLSNANKLVLSEIVENKGFQINDLYGLLIESTSKGTGFTLSLISKGIVPLSAIGIDILETSTDMFKISLSWMGITEKISYDDLMNNIGDIEHPELLLGLLYRKGGLFFSIMGDISKVASRLAIESLTNTTIKSTSLIKGSITNNFEKQASNFEKLSKAMGSLDEKSGNIILKANENLQKIQSNYEVLDILKKETNLAKAKEAISKKLNINISGDIDEFNKLRTHLNGKFQLPHTADLFTGGHIANTFGFGKNADLFELSRKLKGISNQQRAILNNNHLAKGFGKIREVFEIGEISRLGDKVIYHFDDINQATQFSKLLNKAPELIGGLFDKLPIITVAGLAVANEDKIESLQTGFMSLIPFVGPIMLLGEGGVYLNDDGEIEIKNPIEAGMGGVLLGLDSVFFLKEAFKGGARGAIGYLGKPIKDIYSIGRGSVEILADIAKMTKGSFMKDTITKGGKAVSKFPLLGKYGRIAAFAIIGAYASYETLTSNEKEVYDKLIEEGLITKDGNYGDNLKEAIKLGNINEEEKQILIELIIAKYSSEELKDINIRLDGDNLMITSLNKKIKNDFFMTNETITELNTLFSIKYNSNNFNDANT